MKNLNESRKISESKEKLIDKLIEIWPNADFVKGVMAYIESEEEVSEMLDFIKGKGYDDSSEITVHAISLSNSNGNIPEDDFYSDITRLADSIK